jgi:hypothetical protein
VRQLGRSHSVAAAAGEPLAGAQWKVRLNLSYAGVVGVFLGLAVGVGACQLRVPPLVQSVVAVLAAVLLTSGLMWLLGLRYPVLFGDAGGGYFALGVENLLSLGVLAAAGAVLHVALGVFGTALPWVSGYRPMILGGAAGLYAAVSVATAIYGLSRLKLK